MLATFAKTILFLRVLLLGGILNGPHLQEVSHRGTAHPRPAHQILMIRVSQETNPGTGNFDSNILGFVRALQTTGTAADFYMYGKAGPNYGNTEPTLINNTCHVFFVNAADGLALVVVHNKPNDVAHSTWGAAETRFELSGGTAKILKVDDDETEAMVSGGGTVFTGDMHWDQGNTDGMVVGALPVGFTILGQFTAPPRGLDGGWQVISADGTRVPLNLVPGQRVRLDVALHVQVQQGH